MDSYKRMALFAEVVTSGSMTAAARRMGITPSGVSQQVRALEKELGLSLLHRSTRKIKLTEAGSQYFEGCADMVAAARRAEQALARHRDEPEGELRIAVPIGLGGLIANALAPMRKHPKLSLTLLVDDAVVDVLDARIDIALRVGALADSSLVARRLGTLRAQLCAAPSYLAARGWPQHPRDLESHSWLGFRPMGAGRSGLLLIGPDGERFATKLQVSVQASQVTILHSLCVAGWGISAVVSDDDRRAIHDGRLVPVLPDWALPELVISAVTPRRGEQPAKVRHAMELLADYVTGMADRA
jgi:LysR family transcriptional regulator, transcriptional activator for aaeXAB operon